MPMKRSGPAKKKSLLHRGVSWLQDPLLNKGTAFTARERDALGLRGLLPPHVATIEEQVLRVMTNVRKKPNDIERYIYLIGLQDRSEALFYRVIVDHIEEMMPIIYTPTVGKACQEFGSLYRRARGFYVSAEDRGRVSKILANWPRQDVRVIVVTDGQRILGLGDLGAYGMGIPIGKLSLYTACAGIHPAQCLPVMIDVGTENASLLANPLYTGLRQFRVDGAAYDELVDEFVWAVQKRFPFALIQFEDFATNNAFRLLRKYQESVCAFNDDIQGTGAVATAGICTATRITGRRLTDQRILFFGAGEAGIGIADTLVDAMVGEGLSEPEARRRCWFVDSKGLVVQARRDLAEHKRPYAHEAEPQQDLLAAIQWLRPTALIGVSGAARSFDKRVIQTMASLNHRPIIFALSNPTSQSECTAAEAYEWSDGRAIFASGSPFPPVQFEGRSIVPGQGNNAYIFPGVGLGIVVSGAKRVTRTMFSIAAKALASTVTDAELAEGRVYPALGRIREVSAAIAEAVAGEAWHAGLARARKPRDIASKVRDAMYQPRYAEYA